MASQRVGQMGIATSGPKPAHVIVFGNEKGGSGKTTMAVNVIVALLKTGARVASIDTDSRQLSLTRFLENRARWSRKVGVALECPTHYSIKLGEGKVVSDVEEREFTAFAEIIDRLGAAFDYLVVDTPANDSYRMRLSHGMADTLVTPVNDSFVDLDVLGRFDEQGEALTGVSQYAELVGEARRSRAVARQPPLDWIVVRNRIAPLASRNQHRVTGGLRLLSERLGFRVADGVSERVVFREFFPTGVTAFDLLDRAVLGVKPTISHLAARREIRDLIDALGVEPAPVAAAAASGGGVAAGVAASPR